jgi:LacI family transcriptional regulator
LVADSENVYNFFVSSLPPTLPLPTIGNVAQLASVSIATVSRCINQPDTVRAPLRERVLAAIKQLGYVPHAGARTLKSRRTRTIGAVFPTIDNAIFAQAINALQRRLAEANYQLLLATSDYDPTTEENQALHLLSRGAEALVLCGCSQRTSLNKRLQARAVPVLRVMSWPPPKGMSCVGFDNARAMTQVIRYLLDLGHRRIAMLAGVTQHNDRAAARVQGVRDALAAEGLSLPSHWIVERRYSLSAARDGFRQLMHEQPQPTAVVCGNDVLAFGAVLEAQRMGLTVPKDVSIVGFDDLELASHIQPALTTVSVPAEDMWFRAADRVVDMLEGQTSAAKDEIQTSLIVRESTAPPRGVRQH